MVNRLGQALAVTAALAAAGCESDEKIDPDCDAVPRHVQVISETVTDLIRGGGDGCRVLEDDQTIECVFVENIAGEERRASYLFGPNSAGYTEPGHSTATWITRTSGSTVDLDARYSSDYGDAVDCQVEGFH